MNRWPLRATYEITRDVLVTGTGLVIIWRQVLFSALHPSGLLLGTGLALTVPSVAAHVRALLPGGEVPPPSPGGPGGGGESSALSPSRRSRRSSSSAGRSGDRAPMAVRRYRRGDLPGCGWR